ncbi:dihydrofolate reductase family protein [Pontibacillus salicampi]|uniref:Dihydrofolate reductase family protein n=1 Tax=Pontibacillus salicampi TaxID=1449801 RepID=A0ABV6LL34_9BACI
MRRIIVYIATSIDGYIATKEHSLDWLFVEDPEGDAGYDAFYNSIDTVVMGSKTFQWIMEHEGDNPYKGKQSYVFTSKTREDTEDVQFIQGDAVSFMKNVQAQEGKDIWLVGGASIIKSLMEHQLVDEFIISIAPIIIGSGIPLFQEMNVEQRMELVDMKRFGSFPQLHYRRK